MYGAVEAGGTKIVCAVGSGPQDIWEETRFPTESPQPTIAKIIQFFKDQEQQKKEKLAAIGVGSFGPIDPIPSSGTYGYITTTPKPGWQQVDLMGTLKQELRVPMYFDTDVNGAALAEGAYGAAQGMQNYVYLTVGTGIGGGVVVHGQAVHGLIHPEVGHMMVERRRDDPFEGNCPYHGNCWEGMAAGPAIEKRWGKPGFELPDDHPAWELEAHYLAAGITNLLMVLTPEMVILGGGVMGKEQLYPMIREKVRAMANGYIAHPALEDKLDRWIVPPSLGNQAGIAGAMILAHKAAE